MKWVAGLAGFALLVLGGNSLAMADVAIPQSTPTYTNLMAAMRAEAFANARYADYASIAQNAGYVNASQQFTNIGQAKLDQFDSAATLIGFVGSDEDNLKAAIDQATQVSTKDYPQYAAAASAAGDTAAAAVFSQLAADVNSRLATLQSAYAVVTQELNAPAVMPTGPGAVESAITQGPAQASDSTTLDNLNTALQNEAFANVAYMMYAAAASASGDVPLCELFMAIGNVDRYESFRQLGVAYGLYGDTSTNLQNAIAAETATKTVNADYATTATSEGYAAAADHFTTLTTNDTNDTNTLQKRYDAMGSGGTTSGISADPASSSSASSNSLSTSPKSAPAAGNGANASVASLTTTHSSAAISAVTPPATDPSITQSALVGQQIAAKNNQIDTLKASVVKQVPGSPQWVSDWATLNDLYHQLDTLQNPLAVTVAPTAQDLANQRLADIARETAVLNTLVSSTTPTSQSHTSAVQLIQTLSDQSNLITQMTNQLNPKSVPSLPVPSSTVPGQTQPQSQPNQASGQQDVASIQRGQSLIQQGQAMISNGQVEMGQAIVQQGNALVQQGQSAQGQTQTQATSPQTPKPSQPQTTQPSQPPSTQPKPTQSPSTTIQPTQTQSASPQPTATK